MITAVQGIPPILITPPEDAQLRVGDHTQALIDKKANAKENASQTIEPTSANEANTSSNTNFSALAKKIQNVAGDNTIVEFSFDSSSKKIILKVVDPNTKEVIRQIPAEESLKIAQIIASQLEQGQGQVTDAKI